MTFARKVFAILAVLVLSAIALGQVTEHPLVIPGTELGWESPDLNLVMRVAEKTHIALKVYSPGFDPNDYRSADELGDERYDGKTGKLKTSLRILDDKGRVRLDREFFIEPHRWVKLIDGQLSAGDYLINMRFFGDGKNALAFKLFDSSGKVTLQVEPGSMQTYNVHGQKWTFPFSITKRDWSGTFVVGIYDGDGPRELQIRVRRPGGKEAELPVPGNREWIRYAIDDPGDYSFGFRQPIGAEQYTNTVGFQIFLKPVKVEIVDEGGNPVEGGAYQVKGYYDRLVTLTRIPSGWDHVATETQYGKKLDDTRVLFGPGGGVVRFVLRSKTGLLQIESAARCGDTAAPAPVDVVIAGKKVELDSQGRATLRLPAGKYPVRVDASGASVSAPEQVQVASGKSSYLRIGLTPRTDVSIEVKPAEPQVGELVEVHATLHSVFPVEIPARLSLELPQGIKAEGPTEISGKVGGGERVELRTKVRADHAGAYLIKVSGSPCAAAAVASVTAHNPASFKLSKKAFTPEVPQGGKARFAIRVENTGGTAALVRLQDKLPAGLLGQGLEQTFELAPSEVRQFVVEARVADEASGSIVNEALLFSKGGERLASARATVKVLPPRVELSRTLDKRVVIPGEKVHVCLLVKNLGQSRLRYSLRDETPGWLKPDALPEFQGEIPPSGREEHCYDAKVEYGEGAQGDFLATLSSNAGKRTAPDTIRRVLLGLEKVALKKRVQAGDEAEFLISLHNPTDRDLSLLLNDVITLPDGQDKPLFSKTVSLPAGGSSDLRYSTKTEQQGRYENEAMVFLNDTPAAQTASATLEAMPRVVIHRSSRVRLPFAVEGSGESLLIAHRPPPGSSYRLGSSRLDGRPIADPRVDKEGRLYWKIPFENKGVLEYELEHDSALPKLGEPSLTLLASGREISLEGDASIKDYQRAQAVKPERPQNVIVEPTNGAVLPYKTDVPLVVAAPQGENVVVLVNGKKAPLSEVAEEQRDAATGKQIIRYQGLPLNEGKNVVEVVAGAEREKIEIFRAGKPAAIKAIPLKAVADGRSPIRLRIEQEDASGLIAGEGYVTLQAQPEPMTPDADPLTSGYQVKLHHGRAEIELQPMAVPGEISLQMASGDKVYSQKLYAEGTSNLFWLAQGSITVRYNGSVEVGGLGRAYVEAPLAQGTVSGAVDANANLGPSGLAYFPELNHEEKPTKRFPLVGSGKEAKLPLVSDDGVAVRYDDKNLTVGYQRTSLALPGLSGMPNTTALFVQTRGVLRTGAFVTLLPSNELSEEIVPDGTRIYRLAHPARSGSEQVVLRVGAEERRLEPLRDYVLDYPTGLITLAQPLWPNAENLEPVRLLVTYAPETAPRDTLAAGAGAVYDNGHFSFGLAAATLDRGSTWKFGASAGYRTPNFSSKLQLGVEAGAVNLGLSASGREGPFEASANMRYNGSLQGKLRLAGHLSDNDAVALEHRGSSSYNRTSVLYERRFSKEFLAALGAGYEWNTSSLEAVGRLGYTSQRASFKLTHQQSFSTAPSLSVFAARYRIDENLLASGELAYNWGKGLDGVIGLKQRLGPANLSLDYTLPGASGRGNRARFGIVAPLPLSERYTLTFSAGYEKSFNSADYQAAAGVGVRYHEKALSASVGVEGAAGSHGSKITLRAGAAGKIDERQVVSFDANYLFSGNPHGRFTLAYAYRGSSLQLLTYHRVRHDDSGASFEGEIAPTWHPSLSFQLRPSAAYRVRLADPASNIYQLGLGANVYFTPRVGIGAGAYYIWQPALSAGHVSFNIEGSLRAIDPLWLNVGYTFGGFTGITPESRPGVYLRLDVFGGN